MRGKGRHCRQLYRRAGITPAYAGKSSTRLLYVALLKDHPRLCGEKVACYLAAVLQRGSPPPMRGKVHFFSLPRFFTRITPAYAGKSFKNSKFSRVAQDHPRLCGEKGSPSLYSRSSSGSPPPMRGKAPFRFVVVACGGITPAYAGKSIRTLRNSHHDQDHPRLCGEKTFASGVVASFAWITPAYAGKSPSAATFPRGCRDHPRLCGEKFSNCDEKTTCVGSPPPMRGKVALFSAGMCLIRITPAYAGKSVN